MSRRPRALSESANRPFIKNQTTQQHAAAAASPNSSRRKSESVATFSSFRRKSHSGSGSRGDAFHSMHPIPENKHKNHYSRRRSFMGYAFLLFSPLMFFFFQISNISIHASAVSSRKLSQTMKASMMRIALRAVRMMRCLIVLMTKLHKRGKRERVLILLPHSNVLRRTLSLLIQGYLITPL